MTVTAFDVEQDHAVDVDTFDRLVEEGTAQPLHVRDMLIELAALADKIDETKELKATVVERYDDRLRNLETHRQRLRGSIHGFIVNLNEGRPVSIPDAGSAHLTTTQPRLEIRDKDAFNGWASAAGFTEIVVQTTEATRAALKRATEVGEVVPGTEFVPPGKTLTIRLV